MLSNAMNSEMKRVYVFCWIHIRCCILRTFDAAAISRINCCAAGTMLAIGSDAARSRGKHLLSALFDFMNGDERARC